MFFFSFLIIVGSWPKELNWVHLPTCQLLSLIICISVIDNSIELMHDNNFFIDEQHPFIYHLITPALCIDNCGPSRKHAS